MAAAISKKGLMVGTKKVGAFSGRPKKANGIVAFFYSYF